MKSAAIRAQRIACVLIPDFPVAVERFDLASLAGLPVVVGGGLEQRQEVLSCSDEARAYNIHEGLPLRSVIARCSSTVMLEARPGRYDELCDVIHTSLGKISPFVEQAAWGEWYVSLDGLKGIHKTDAALLTALQQAANSAGIPAQIGVAQGRFTARVAAFGARPGAPAVVKGARRFLARLPVSVLPVPAAMRQRLGIFGVTTLGDLAAMQVGAMQAQFGPDGKLAWDLANGIDDTLLRIYDVPVMLSDRFVFEQPVTTSDIVYLAVRQLLDRLTNSLRFQYRAARGVAFTALLENGQRWERTVTFREPMVETRRMALALRGKLDAFVPASAISEVVVSLLNVCAEGGVQEPLPDPGHTNRLKEVKDAVRQLVARYGENPIAQIVEVEPWSRLPERRYALVDYEA